MHKHQKPIDQAVLLHTEYRHSPTVVSHRIWKISATRPIGTRLIHSNVEKGTPGSNQLEFENASNPDVFGRDKFSETFRHPNPRFCALHGYIPREVAHLEFEVIRSWGLANVSVPPHFGKRLHNTNVAFR